MEKSQYADNLRVTELEPLMNYIRSSISAEDIFAPEFETLEKELSAVLKKDGEIFISKDSGLFKVLK